MHYYEFNIPAWVLHTSHLTLEEECVYRRLLDYYYDTEKPIPEETKPVMRRLRLVNYEDIANQILSEFFHLEADGWHNNRADIVIAKYQSNANKARENGKKGGRPKQNKEQETHPVILANPEETTLKANYKQLTINNELETKLKDITPAAPPATPKKKPAKTGSRLPDDWRPTQDYVNAAMQLNPDYTREWFSATAHKFRDYWVAKTGKDATKADWLATWRNWVRNDLEYNRGKSNAKPKQLDNESTDWVGLVIGSAASGNSGEQDLQWLEGNFSSVGGSDQGSGLPEPSQGGMAQGAD